MRHLAEAGDCPAISVVQRMTNFAFSDTSRIVSRDGVKTVRTAMFFDHRQLDFWLAPRAALACRFCRIRFILNCRPVSASRTDSLPWCGARRRCPEPRHGLVVVRSGSVRSLRCKTHSRTSRFDLDLGVTQRFDIDHLPRWSAPCHQRHHR